MSGYVGYPEYRDSGVAWLNNLPEHWELLKGGYIGSLFGSESVSETALSTEGSIPYIKVSDLEQDSLSCSTFENYYKGQTSRNTKLVTEFIVFPKRGAAIFTNKVNIVKQYALLDPNLMGWVIHDRSSTIFYAWLLKARGLSDIADVSTVPQINNKHIEPEKFPAPPFDEQQKIANFLDHETSKIDTLIEKQQQLIKLLKEKRQAVISHAVTKGLNPDAPMNDSGVEWLGEVPAGWVKKLKLSSFAESNRGSFVNGPFGSDLLSVELRDKGVPVVYIRDISRLGYRRKSTVCVTPEKAEQLEVCKVLPGDVIVSKVGDPPGDACVYPDGQPNAIVTQDVIRIRVNKDLVDPFYVSSLLNSDFGRTVVNNVSVEGTRKRVSLGDFKAIRFVIPSLEEQVSIGEYLNFQCAKFDDLLGKSQDMITLMKERRTALISAAVTGKIDVRNWQPPESSSTSSTNA